MSETGFQVGLLVVLFIGAANADATLAQRRRLKDEVLPILGDRATPPRQAMVDAVRHTAVVMGPNWRPTGEWDTWITSILEEQEMLS